MENGFCECGCGNNVSAGRRFISGHNRVGKSKPTVDIKCAECENIFSVIPSMKNRVYCSNECRDNHRRKRTGEKHPLYNRTHINCGVCNKEITITPSLLKRKRKIYCSKECGHIAQANALRGKVKVTNRSGKRSARVRDGNKCVMCGFEHAVAVHHIVSVKDGGSNELTNLVTLCPNHHYMAHMNMIPIDDLKKYASEFSFHNGVEFITSSLGKGPNFRG
jgi:hypothetical protein